MAFFRIKKIKGKEYAYVVENEWSAVPKSLGTLSGMKPKGSRQKVKGYLGKAYRFDAKNNSDFLEFVKAGNFQEYLEKNGNVIFDLIEWELFRNGIDKKEFLIDIADKKVQKNGKNVALLINEGYLCSMTLRNLLEFKPEPGGPNEGYRFARAFIEAGIKVPKDVFIGLFGRLYKQTEMPKSDFTW